VLQPTGAANPVDSFSWRAEPSHAADVATLTSAGRKPIQRLQSDSSDSATSTEASDSDSDDAPVAKKKCPSSRLDVSSSRMPPAAAGPKTKYNIWGSVLQEQTLAKDLGSWFGMKTKVISDRDVETYDYRNAMLVAENSSNNADAVDIDIADDGEDQQTNDDDDANICDRETFGTSTSTKFSDTYTESPEQNCSEIERLSRKRRHNDSMAGFSRQLQMNADVNRQSARNRLSRRTYDRQKDRSHVRVNVNDAVAAVAQELLRVLGEPEYMKDTFGNFLHVNSLICM